MRRRSEADWLIAFSWEIEVEIAGASGDLEIGESVDWEGKDLLEPEEVEVHILAKKD